MVRSKIAAAILSAGLVLPGLAAALGVGDYTLKSYLNQPLELEIDLIQTADLTTEEVMAVLAPQEDFERLGMERDYFLTNLRFEIAQRASGSLYVVARSVQPVNEPFLNFLVQVQWPQGRMLREYTILLDPPIFKTGAAPTATDEPVVVAAPAPAVVPAQVPEPVAAPVYAPVYAPASESVMSDLPPPPSGSISSSVASESMRTATPDATPDATPEPARQPVAMMAAGDYLVQANDTMMQIAARNRAGNGSLQQTMIAIQRANPEAFIKGNINLVKKGAVLRMPDETEVQQISASEAGTEFASQTRAWREMLDSRAAMLPSESAQLQAGKTTGTKAGVAKGTGAGEVTLVAPSAASGGSKASGGRDLEKLQNQLAIAEEGMDKSARENKELASRLADLDKQVKASGRLLGMKNDQIAGLQAELNQLRKDKGLPPVAAASEVAVAAPAADTAATAVDATTAADTAAPVTQTGESPAAIPADAEATTETVTDAAQPTSMLVPIVAVLGAIGLGGAGLWFWRRKQQPQVDTADDDAHVYADDNNDAQAADDLAQLQDFNLGNELDGGADMHDAAASAAAPAESGDPLGEADMYAAYGRFQQAADILYAALQREPEREDIRTKLAEVYAEMGDAGSAREHADVLVGSKNAGIRQQAAAVLARTGGNSAVTASEEKLPSLDDLALEFSGGTPGSATADVAEELSFDLDEDATGVRGALDFSPKKSDTDIVNTAVRAKTGSDRKIEENIEDLALDDVDMSDFSLTEDPAAAVISEEFSLDGNMDADIDFSADLEMATSAPAADDLSLEQSWQEDAVAEEIVAAVPTAVETEANLDLEEELADLQSAGSAAGNFSAGSTDSGDDFDFLADADEHATKLDLAKAYIDMGEADGARDILNEVLADGSAAQKDEAKKLMGQLA